MASHKKYALIIFAKFPKKGHSKTRLAKDLGDDKTLLIAECLLYNTLMKVKFFMQKDVDIYVYYDGFFPYDKRKKYAYFCEQKGDDLGEKLYRAFQDQIYGDRKVIVIGTDTPDLSIDHMIQAFHKLEQYDVVLGPSEDGGYYLLGMSGFHGQLLQDIPWSSEHVFQKTTYIAQQSSLRSYYLENLMDIDFLDDLKKWCDKNCLPFDDSIEGFSRICYSLQHAKIQGEIGFSSIDLRTTALENHFS